MLYEVITELRSTARGHAADLPAAILRLDGRAEDPGGGDSGVLRRADRGRGAPIPADAGDRARDAAAHPAPCPGAGSGRKQCRP